MALINPEVKILPGKTVIDEEGCLSFPHIRGDVPRAEAIKVVFQDTNGVAHTLVCSGWFARVIQHEVDHIHGRLFIDIMDKRQLRTLDAKIKRLKQNTRKALLQ
jgi:peptide deformylase